MRERDSAAVVPDRPLAAGRRCGSFSLLIAVGQLATSKRGRERRRGGREGEEERREGG